MASFSITAEGTLELTPSKNSSESDFDFLEGSWHVHNRKLNQRLTNCQEWTEFEATGTLRKILQGFGNIDDFITAFDGKPFEGMSLRIFNPQTKLWAIYWSDTSRYTLDKPVYGSFDGDLATFYCFDVFNGKEILVKFQWDKSDPAKPVWSQAFSPDNGKTWEWNWYMTFTTGEELSTVGHFKNECHVG